MKNKFWLLICTVVFFPQTGLAAEPITPIPQSLPTDAAKVALGKKLFFDVRLSKNNNESCATCHNLVGGFGTDLAPTSTGSDGYLGARNAPTVYNSALNFAQFWDGRADNLAHQAEGPVVNPVEMGMTNWTAAIRKIENDAEYKKMFGKIYQGEMTKETVTDAIAEFEKTLLTPNSPFDRWLKGDDNALTQLEKTGYQRFKQYGCVACHQGQNVGGNMYQKFGIMKDISKTPLGKDMGRFDITKNDMDRHFFRVPSLRLVAKTPPYFHDGSVPTLDQAVKTMAEYQLGWEIPQKDVDAIVAFLKSLAGDLPKGVSI